MWIFAGFLLDFHPILDEERSSASATINSFSFLLINKMKAINRLFDDLKLALPRFTSKV
jgi:hypothetical protein